MPALPKPPTRSGVQSHYVVRATSRFTGVGLKHANHLDILDSCCSSRRDVCFRSSCFTLSFPTFSSSSLPSTVFLPLRLFLVSGPHFILLFRRLHPICYIVPASYSTALETSNDQNRWVTWKLGVSCTTDSSCSSCAFYPSFSLASFV